MDTEAIKKKFTESFFADQSTFDQFLFFLVSRELRRKGARNKILCLLGVPGGGKRAMIHGLSRAMDWKLVTVKLGEVTSADGQVVGSFRTDLNAITARIVHALDGLQGDNVALLLEDLDKINPPALHNGGIDFFSLLEQMQQYAVQNNYKQNPIDLSSVIFLATAKNLAMVPSGLREQLQIVKIPTYSEADKLKIIKKYVLPRLEQTYCLTGKAKFSDNGLIRLIREYSREGGVGQVQADLETICKKLVVRLESGNKNRQERVYANSVHHFLGPARYPIREDQGTDKVGVVSLLGKSEKGGCILVMEALGLIGKGKILITGNTDKLFEESARVAVSHLRTCSYKYEIDQNFFQNRDIHLHMQYGQVPKYGVSAGAGIFAVIVSALSGRPVRGNVGVTGEISLQGRILGVSDIRDKVLGACQAGLKQVYVPKENERDVCKLAADIVRSVEITLVDNVQELLSRVIIWSDGPDTRAGED